MENKITGAYQPNSLVLAMAMAELEHDRRLGDEFKAALPRGSYQGQAIVMGTGGDFDTEGLEAIFTNPEAYNCLPLQTRQLSYFTPQKKNWTIQEIREAEAERDRRCYPNKPWVKAEEEAKATTKPKKNTK